MTGTAPPLPDHCHRLTDALGYLLDGDGRRCGRPRSHPIHDPLGDGYGVARSRLHPYDPAPPLVEDEPHTHEPDDGLAFDPDDDPDPEGA